MAEERAPTLLLRLTDLGSGSGWWWCNGHFAGRENDVLNFEPGPSGWRYPGGEGMPLEGGLGSIGWRWRSHLRYFWS